MAIRHMLIGSASAIGLLAGTAHAQSTDPNQPPTNAPPSGDVQVPPSDTGSADEIVITGIRGSAAASIRAKRASSVISDVLTAEDIGKFPDKNVAEALQRIPGVVINHTFGEGERVSVRGTDTNLTKTLLNGHNVATADWFIEDQLAATRSFNYLTLPSEIVGQLEVYKSPQADIEEGGVGATINVHTRNPLDLDPLTISASAQMVYSERAKKWDPQASGLISWKKLLSGSDRVVIQACCPGASPIWYGSLTTVAPAALSLANSPRTSAVSMFQISRPGAVFLPLT